MFLTYEEQIKNLLNNGLIIPDEEVALNLLKKVGYYNLIKGYSSYFKKNKKYCKSCKFDEIFRLYQFDKNLSAIVYKYATELEINIKAMVAHSFSEKYGHELKKYLVKDNFRDDREEHVKELIKITKKIIKDGSDKNNRRYRKYIAHHKENYDNVPLWILIKAYTFGNISVFYDLMKDDDKKIVADEYNINSELLSNMLEMIVLFRNTIAHGEKLFSIRTPKVRLTNILAIYDKLGIRRNKGNDPIYGRSDFLALMIIFKYLIDPIKFSGFTYEVDVELEQLKKSINVESFAIVLKEMGLKGSWRQLHKMKI